MALTQEQKYKIVEWRRLKGIENCIACGFSGEMRYGDPVALPIVGFGGQTVIVGSGERTIISGGQTVISSSGGRVVFGGEEVESVSGIVPIACPHCEYAMLFSEKVLSL